MIELQGSGLCAQPIFVLGICVCRVIQWGRQTMSSPVDQQSAADQAEHKSIESVNSGREDGNNSAYVETAIRKMIKQKQKTFDRNFDVPFFLGDLRKIKSQYEKWKTLLPRVDLFYAVKCCGEAPVLKLLVDMGASFDCASKNEIEMMLNLGADASRIIFAHTVKPVSSLQFASDNKVSLMTFDNEEELEKVKKYYPEARLVFRLRCRESTQVEINFGLMFGCRIENAERLLNKAKSLQLNVVGVSFHVGSGVSHPVVFEDAIRDSLAIFQIARRAGYNFNLLDIGGGFLGHDDNAFKPIAEGLTSILEKYFPVSTGVRIIAEPGRYVVSSAYTWVVQVTGKRSREGATKGVVYEDRQRHIVSPRYIYYVNDGHHGAGSINTKIMRLKPLTHKALDDRFPSQACDGRNTKMALEMGLNRFPAIRDVVNGTTETYSSAVYGPTLAPWDVLYRDISLPELYVGDWLYMENAGAYSMTLASDFNMMPKAQCYYVHDEQLEIRSVHAHKTGACTLLRL